MTTTFPTASAMTRRSLKPRAQTLLFILASSAAFFQQAAQADDNHYAQTVLVANRPEFKPQAFVDKHLVNPWGIALRPPGKGGHIWVSNAGNASTSLYIGDVNGVPLHQDGLKIVGLEGPLISYEDGLPNVTGQVYNAASDLPGQPVEFPVNGEAVNLSSGESMPLEKSSGSTKFVFVTTDGTINAWRSNTAEAMTKAVIVKDFSDKGPQQMHNLRFLPAFTGVAMTTRPAGKDAAGHVVADNRLYVTDFQNKRIQVFDNQWKEITASVPFARPAGLPDEYSPYNVQCIGDKIYVVYAVLDADSEEPATDLPGKGAGHVAVYDRDGHFLQEFQDQGWLNSPWGITLAPEGFGAMSGKLLVANFGDGTIAAFEPESGAPIDYLRDAEGKALNVDGIWGLVFGNGVSLGDAHALYFTAGPENEQDGVFGRVNVAPPATTLSKNP